MHSVDSMSLKQYRGGAWQSSFLVTLYFELTGKEIKHCFDIQCSNLKR